MNGPYSAGGLWLLDGKGNRIALCYTMPTAVDLAKRLNAATGHPTYPVDIFGACLACGADQGTVHKLNCPNR